MYTPFGKTANYIVMALAVLAIAYIWVQRWQSRLTLTNPLIPARLSDIHYKPALLFTLLFAVIVLLQCSSLYFKKGYYATAALGVLFVIGGLLFYPFAVTLFLR